jgi:hypothetical protein
MIITSALPQKEDGRVVTHEIPNALVGVELDGKTARISGGVGRSRLSTHSRKADCHGDTVSCLLEERGSTIRPECLGVCHFKVTKGTTSLGVYDAFRNAFAIKGGQVIK